MKIEHEIKHEKVRFFAGLPERPSRVFDRMIQALYWTIRKESMGVRISENGIYIEDTDEWNHIGVSVDIDKVVFEEFFLDTGIEKLEAGFRLEGLYDLLKNHVISKIWFYVPSDENILGINVILNNGDSITYRPSSFELKFEIYDMSRIFTMEKVHSFTMPIKYLECVTNTIHDDDIYLIASKDAFEVRRFLREIFTVLRLRKGQRYNLRVKLVLRDIKCGCLMKTLYCSVALSRN